jgi:hypothetical protein
MEKLVINKAGLASLACSYGGIYLLYTSIIIGIVLSSSFFVTFITGLRQVSLNKKTGAAFE